MSITAEQLSTFEPGQRITQGSRVLTKQPDGSWTRSGYENNRIPEAHLIPHLATLTAPDEVAEAQQMDYAYGRVTNEYMVLRNTHAERLTHADEEDWVRVIAWTDDDGAAWDGRVARVQRVDRSDPALTFRVQSADGDTVWVHDVIRVDPPVDEVDDDLLDEEPESPAVLEVGQLWYDHDHDVNYIAAEEQVDGETLYHCVYFANEVPHVYLRRGRIVFTHPVDEEPDYWSETLRLALDMAVDEARQRYAMDQEVRGSVTREQLSAFIRTHEGATLDDLAQRFDLERPARTVSVRMTIAGTRLFGEATPMAWSVQPILSMRLVGDQTPESQARETALRWMTENGVVHTSFEVTGVVVQP